MRLRQVEHGHRLDRKLFLQVAKLMSGRKTPDVVKALMYRPEIWGGRMSVLFQECMRGPSDWSPGEREIFAAFVSKLNQCPF